MRNSMLRIALIPVALLFTAPASSYAQVQDPTTDAITTARAWVTALDGHEFDSAIALLDDNAYLIIDSPPPSPEINTYQGKAEIRQALPSFRSSQSANGRCWL